MRAPAGRGTTLSLGFRPPRALLLRRGCLVALAAVAGVTLARTFEPSASPAGPLAGPSTPRVSPTGGLASLPLAAQGPVSAALGDHDPAYWVRGLRAGNPEQRLRLEFSAAGVTLASGAGHVRLSLRGFGRAAPLAVHANRVIYSRPGLREWYANGPLGLEQGFSIARRPSRGGDRLSLAIALTGNLRPALHDGSLLLTGHGASLRYGGLVATDAHGRRLPAALLLRGRRIVISVNDRGARYPVRIDPFSSQAFNLNEPAGYTFDAFGYSTAVSGSTIAVGAPSHQVANNASQGAVFVFTEPSTGWATTTQSTMLTASDGAADDALGYTVATNGTAIVSGAPQHSVDGHAGQGAAYVWVEHNGTWPSAQTAELTAPDGTKMDDGGYLPVAISPDGNTIVFGTAFQKVGSNGEQGEAYAFTQPAGGWGSATPQVAELTASDGAANDVYGLEVAASDDTLAVDGGLNGGGSEQGAIYIYTKIAGAWKSGGQQAELTASGTPTLGVGSGSLAISSDGSTVAAGSPISAVGANSGQGEVFVFVRPGLTWAANASSQTATLTAADGVAGAGLGFAVGISGTTGTTIVASAPQQTVGSAGSAGAVYVFDEPAAGWSGTVAQPQELTAPTTAAAALGYSLGFDGTTIAAGTRGQQLGDYVFTPPTTTTTTTTGGGTTTTTGGGGPSAPPANTARPVITGTPKNGHTLTCSSGTWTNAPTHYAYQWSLSGTPIAGATTSSYKVQSVDEGLSLTCAVTASNAKGPGAPATSAKVKVPVPKVARCPAATGSLASGKVGQLRLGMTRTQARHAYRKSSDRGQKYEDFFCLTPRGIRDGYGSSKEPKRYREHVIWISTSSAYYTVHGIRVEASIPAAKKTLKLAGPYVVGKNTWYFTANGSSNAIFKVRKNLIEEIGIADKALTKGKKAQLRFLTSFS